MAWLQPAESRESQRVCRYVLRANLIAIARGGYNLLKVRLYGFDYVLKFGVRDIGEAG